MIAVDRTQITLLICPFVPDRNTVFLQIGNVRIALQEPQQFVDNGTQMQFLCRDDRKPIRKIETHLIAENGARASSGPVSTVGSGFHDMAKKVGYCFMTGL